MKKTLSLSLASLAFTASLILTGCWEHGHHHPDSPTAPPDVIVGSGRIVREDRPISGVYGVRLVGVGNVDIRQSSTEKLVVEAEDNLIEFLTTEVIGGVLVISQDPDVSIQPTRRIAFYLDVISLERADVVGAGNLTCEALRGSRLAITALGVGRLSFLNLSLDELEIDQGGVGTILTSGEVRNQRVNLTGVGVYKAEALDSSAAWINLLSVGSATVRVRDQLFANVVGTGCVYYIGNPTVETSATGDACIRRID